jgi:hypothetical protein
MKKTVLILMIGWITVQLQAQNYIGLQVGFLGTHTSIAEYERIERNDYLLDSVTLSQNVGSVQVALNTDIGLGKNFFLSTGFHYSSKGLANITFVDNKGWPWSTPARQQYVGLSMLIGYKLPLGQSKFALQAATGPQVDFAIGTPNGGALYSGLYYRFFLPFSRFNEVDLSWIGEIGCSYKLGPGDLMIKATYQYGLSDVLEDAYIVSRSMSFGISAGYSFKL